MAFNKIPYGYYPATDGWAPEIRANRADVASALGITSDKLVSGHNICGVSGNATVQSLGGVNVKIGSTTAVCSGSGGGSFKFSISELGFVPRLIIATATDGSQQTLATIINQSYYTNIIPVKSLAYTAFHLVWDSSGANYVVNSTSNTVYYNEFGNGFYNGHMSAYSRNTKTWTIQYLAIG